ncbi:hypothetical protein DY000_02058693 [Brassica cretica]|uniref:Uncharacterized protein n=1 Tax=Brassica cretica TaxID=69181 RepID=A0ABQ7APN2_BRACR|nr:hypothetical protein DY000_02058693 [Brassica cretica]
MDSLLGEDSNRISRRVQDAITDHEECLIVSLVVLREQSRMLDEDDAVISRWIC